MFKERVDGINKEVVGLPDAIAGSVRRDVHGHVIQIGVKLKRGKRVKRKDIIQSREL